MTPRLYLVVRDDLSPGRRAAQLCHALREFGARFPAQERAWFERSNTLVLLELPRRELRDLLEALSARREPVAEFHEPDLNDELTAIATFENPLMRGLPLALASP